MPRRPCLGCQRLIARGSRCPGCKATYDAQWSGEWRNVRARAAERDGSCVVCGSTRNLHGHHLDKVSNGHRLHRVVTLCNRCHPKVERGLIQL